VSPFVALSLFDSPQLHQIASGTFADCEYPTNTAPELKVRKKNGDRIRIGYYSADFCEHPVAYLLAELIELHSRGFFEIYAFSFVTQDNGDMRKRLRKSFDFFYDVGDKTDEEVAKLSRVLEIDIAVDLGGYTKYARAGIFAYRAAPIQLSYLGYLGTMGAKFMDYLIADQILIPKSSQRYYSERIIYLPSYQVNDSKRKIADKKFTKKELGLPETGFVFCCFNNSYKILPATVDSWVRILKSVDESVLFLYEDNAITRENLKKEAAVRGVSCNKLVFGGRLDRAEYLARYQVADLFLDTTPYNAGTTASDALWAGLPIITMTGESFPSRMAESILNTISLLELVTTSPKEYEELAIDLAQNPEKLKVIRAKLAIKRLTAPLFDAPMFTKNIESAYQKIYQRYLTGSLPEHIYIE
jgi:predicted O-linked N-acetylglucosamine transferase (SPINDLY family)